MEVEKVYRIVNTLFPSQGRGSPCYSGRGPVKSGVRGDSGGALLSSQEDSWASHCPRPGRFALRGLGPGVHQGSGTRPWCFNRCLRKSVFPDAWKRARLMLIPKPAAPSSGPPSFRPICLLDELGKLFKRAVGDLERWRTFLAFCKKVQHVKKDAERLLQGQPLVRIGTRDQVP
ncbi:uncharacterized protein LOC109863243 [Pseudomyrmex gracilis]|uniref:uncharacterized protein LOC109863243 n=1 Tax=Pseudomyrmex gracilis TaxID=219809 RepID=UPI000995C4D6|nr:uncharacterized protein LOC109863243 [Pseudomyrmex gracilis]